jgi:hypothetical protein
MGGVVIAAATIILYTPWLPLLDLREIAVRGASYIPQEEILRTAGFRVGENLFRLRVLRAQRAIARLPWAERVSIHRVFLHGVTITVEEREPIASVVDPLGGTRLLVLGDGAILVQEATKDLHPPLVVRGAPFAAYEPGARLNNEGMATALEHLHHLGLTQGLFQLVDFTNEFSVTLQGADDLMVYLGELDKILPRIDALGALLQTIDPSKYRSMDLRVGGEAVLVPRKVVNR